MSEFEKVTQDREQDPLRLIDLTRSNSFMETFPEDRHSITELSGDPLERLKKLARLTFADWKKNADGDYERNAVNTYDQALIYDTLDRLGSAQKLDTQLKKFDEPGEKLMGEETRRYKLVAKPEFFEPLLASETEFLKSIRSASMSKAASQ